MKIPEIQTQRYKVKGMNLTGKDIIVIRWTKK